MRDLVVEVLTDALSEAEGEETGAGGFPKRSDGLRAAILWVQQVGTKNPQLSERVLRGLLTRRGKSRAEVSWVSIDEAKNIP